MKKAILFFSLLVAIAGLSLSFSSRPREDASRLALGNVSEGLSTDTAATIASDIAHNHLAEVNSLSKNLYTTLNLEQKGLAKLALDVAVKGYLTLQESGRLMNPNLLTIVDLSQSSRKRRFYLIDVKNAQLLENTFVAHAKNSGVDRAESFSNTIGSEKSSLGFYVTKGTYTGKHGLSLRLSGLEEGFNNNAEARAIVVHGADYVNAERVQSPYMGRSQGCPAVPMESYVRIINQIRNGSALFVYTPNTTYLQNSALLNS